MSPGRPDALLAILGGAPTFAEPLHVGRPNIGDRQRLQQLIDGMLDRRWFSNDGPLVRAFEAEVARYLGVRHCVMMANATVAMEIAVRALGLQGEVIVPAYTFVATAHALQWQGITPVFADLDESTHNLDPAQVAALITPRTTGIIGVHVWGRPCAPQALEALARDRGLALLFDAAHAFGCSSRQQLIGGFGACEVFSFHATKFLNSLEGGAVTTNDDALAERLRLMRNFGFAGLDRVISLGINGKMTEASAAMGLCSLAAIDDIIAVNRANHAVYRAELENVPGLRVVDYPSNERHNHQYVVVEVDPDQSPLDRDALVAVLHAENVLARKYFWPGVHRMEPYRSVQPDAHRTLPRTERLAARVLVLPTGQSVSVDDVRAMCAIVQRASEAATEVREAVAREAVAREAVARVGR